MPQNNTPLNQGPFLGVPSGGVRFDEPDGVSTAGSNGTNALRDLQPKTAHPPIDEEGCVGHYETSTGGERASVHNVSNRMNRRRG
jgi:hypothetical protein